MRGFRTGWLTAVVALVGATVVPAAPALAQSTFEVGSASDFHAAIETFNASPDPGPFEIVMTDAVWDWTEGPAYTHPADLTIRAAEDGYWWPGEVRGSELPVPITLVRPSAPGRFLTSSSAGRITLRGLDLADFTGSEGAVLDAIGDVVVDGTRIADSEAAGDGGAVRADGDVVVVGSLLEGNRAGLRGGAVQAEGAVHVLDSVLAGNEAGVLGGAVHSSARAVLEGSVVRDGGATISGGGVEAPIVEVRAARLTNNRASVDGAAIRAGQVVLDGASVDSNELTTDDVTGVADALADTVGLPLYSLVASRIEDAAGGTVTVDASASTAFSTLHDNSLPHLVAGTSTMTGALVTAARWAADSCRITGEASVSWSHVSDPSCGRGEGTEFGDGLPQMVDLDTVLLPSLLHDAVDMIPASACEGASDGRGVQRPVGPGCDAGAGERLGSIGEPILVADESTYRSALEELSADPVPVTELVLAADLTFTSPYLGDAAYEGARQLVVDGNGHVVDVNGGWSMIRAVGPVMVRDVTVTGAVWNAIYAPVDLPRSQVGVRVEEATFVDNHAIEWGGSAIEAPNASVEVVDSHFEDNSGVDAPVEAGRDVFVERSTFVHNQSEGAAAVAAGFIGFEGDATVVDSHFEDNHGSWSGAVSAGDRITAIRSTFLANTSGAYGGALDTLGDVVVDGSTFVDNEAALTGGAIDTSGDVWVANSTFVGNHAPDGGGAINNHEQATVLDLVHVTLVGNGPTQVRAATADISSFATLFHDPDGVASANCEVVSGQVQSQWSWSDDATCGMERSGNEPRLSPLETTRGTTPTMAPRWRSPLIDAVPTAACVLAVDQRGADRPARKGCDIGAVEVQSPREP